MKKILTVSLLLSGLLLANTEITFTKNFTTKVKPDTLGASVTFSVERLSQNTVTEKLTAMSEFVSRETNVKSKGGEYNIHPHTVYENQKSFQDGYDGSISYQLTSKNPKTLNKFIRELQRKAEEMKLKSSISSSSWSMDDASNITDMQIETLRSEAIIWSDSYAESLSHKIGKKCTISKINFNDNTGGHYPRMMKASVAMSDSAPTPTQDEQNISTGANIEMVCK